MGTTAVSTQKTATDPPPLAKPQVGSNSHAKHSARHQLKTIEDIDQRTIAYRRAKKLFTTIQNDLAGDLTAGQHQLASHGAFLGALLESWKAEWLAGKPIDLNIFLATINSQRRILLALGLQRRSRDVTPPSFDDIAREEAERDAAEGDDTS